MSGPRLTEIELIALDQRLQHLCEALIARPPRPYDQLVAEVRGVLTSVERQLVNEGREKEHPGRWDWEREWQSLDGHLTWARFGSDRIPVWKALHEAFTELVRFVIDATTSVSREEYAGRLVASLREYLELRGHAEQEVPAPDTVEWSVPRGVRGWARLFGHSAKTMGRWFRKNLVRNRKLTRQSYQVAVDDIPAAHRGRCRARASR